MSTAYALDHGAFDDAEPVVPPAPPAPRSVAPSSTRGST